MKKFFLSAICLTLALTCFSAQEQFGIRAGYNISNVHSSDFDSFNERSLFHIGFFSSYNLTDDVLIQPEALFTKKGTQYDYLFWGEVMTEKETYTYIEIPLLIKYSVEANWFSFQPYVGPSVGFLIRARSKNDVDISKYMKKVETGLNFGFDWVINHRITHKVTTNKYFFGVRYNLGLSNIDDVKDIDLNLKNRTLMFNFGGLF